MRRISISRSNAGSLCIPVGMFTTLQCTLHGSIKWRSGSIALLRKPFDGERLRVSKNLQRGSTSSFRVIMSARTRLSERQQRTQSSKKQRDFINLFLRLDDRYGLQFAD